MAVLILMMTTLSFMGCGSGDDDDDDRADDDDDDRINDDDNNDTPDYPGSSSDNDDDVPDYPDYPDGDDDDDAVGDDDDDAIADDDDDDVVNPDDDDDDTVGDDDDDDVPSVVWCVDIPNSGTFPYNIFYVNDWSDTWVDQLTYFNRVAWEVVNNWFTFPNIRNDNVFVGNYIAYYDDRTICSSVEFVNAKFGCQDYDPDDGIEYICDLSEWIEPEEIDLTK